MSINNYKNTRAAVHDLSKYINGNTVDFGAGSAKYKSIIIPHTTKYTTFDMVPGPSIDVVGDACNPPFPDNTFDTVISTQMLEHVERPWVVVHEIQRILKPGGICIITAPFITPYHADPYDFFRYTVQGMESLFTHEDCAIVESGRYGNTPTVLSEMIHFSHFSHYKKLSKTRQWWRDHFMNGLKRVSAFIDPYFKNDALYANVYVVARKK